MRLRRTLMRCGMSAVLPLGPSLGLLAGGTPAVAAAGPVATAEHVGRAPVPTPNPSSTANFLTGVSAVSARNAWAVGYYHSDRTGAEMPLILHWNGRRWARTRGVPSPGRTFNFLYAVSATSASNAWAVGRFVSRSGADDSLILHWNGRRWSRTGGVPSPSSTSNSLYGVAAVSATTAWAVGQYRNDSTGQLQTLILRWNGRRWKHVRSPNPSPGPQDGNILNGVAAISRSSAWAVGYYFTSTSTTKTLILHWNGKQWARPPGGSPSPSRLGNFLYGVTAVSPGRAWAVGQYDKAANTGVSLILRWTGTAWKRAGTVPPGPNGNLLTSVSATSANSAWAVGISYSNVAGTTGSTLVLHLTGSGSSKVRSTNGGSGFDILNGVSATSARNAWAVGYFTHNGISRTLAEHWNGRRWS